MANIFKSLLKHATPLLRNIPYVGSVLEGAANDYFQKQDTNDAFAQQLDYQTQLMNHQHANNVDMFNRQLQANKTSIIDQMSQYKQLGINPLAVSGGVQQSNMASTSPSSIPSSFQPQSPLMDAQIDLLRSEAEKNRADASAIDPNLQKSQTAYYMSMAETNNALRDGLVKLQNGEIELQKQQKRLTVQQVRKCRAEINNLNALTDNYESGTRLNDKQGTAIDKELALQEMRTKAEINHWNNQDKAEFNKIALQAREVSQFIKESNQRIENLKSQKNLTDEQARTEYWNQSEIKNRCKLLDIEYNFQTSTFDWNCKARNAQLRYQFAVSENGDLQTKFNTQFLNDNWDDLQNLQYLDNILTSCHVGFNFGGFVNYSTSNSNVRSKSESNVRTNSENTNMSHTISDVTHHKGRDW